jgi:hypothetical protein
MRKPNRVRRALSARDYEKIQEAIRESERGAALLQAILDDEDARDPLAEEARAGLVH